MNRTELQVEGMSCGSCVHHVDQALSELQGVRQVEVLLRDGKVIVHHDGEAVSTTDLVNALQAAGYPAHISA